MDLFLLTAVVIVLVPGLDTALVTRNVIAHGRKGGVKTALGTATGVAIHTLLAAVGLSVIVLQSALAFEMIKYLGAAYLLVLGTVAFWPRGKPHGEAAFRLPVVDQSPRRFLYTQGLLNNVLNPKAAIFFWTFLPQFVRPGATPVQAFFWMGLVLTLLTVLWFLIYVTFLSYLDTWIQRSSVKRRIERLSGIALIAFGVKLVFEHR